MTLQFSTRTLGEIRKTITNFLGAKIEEHFFGVSCKKKGKNIAPLLKLKWVVPNVC